MANPPPMLPGLGFPVDSEIDLLRKWTWNTWLWAQEDFQPSDIPGLGPWYSAGHSAFDAYTYEQAIPTLFDRSGNGWNATQATGTAQARFLTHDGPNYLRLPGIAGNNVTTPNVAANQAGAQIDVKLRVARWGGASYRLMAKSGSAGSRSWSFNLPSTGQLQSVLSGDGTATTTTTTSATGLDFTVPQWVRMTFGPTAGELRFWLGGTSDQPQWSVFETHAMSFSALFNTTRSVELGSGADLAHFNGQVFHASISLTVDGQPTQVFDPSRGNFNSATIGSATGETWTINRTGFDPAMIVSARAFLPSTDDFYDIAAGAAGVLRNVGGGTIIWASSAAGASNTGMAISGGTSATENRMASSSNPTATTLSVGGRRLDSDSLVTNAVAGQQAAYGFAVQAGRLNYASALSAVFKNGSMVGTESAFQTAGNTSNTASLRMRVFANVTEVVDGFASGPTTDLLLYNRALTNAEIFNLSRWLQAQAGIT